MKRLSFAKMNHSASPCPVPHFPVLLGISGGRSLFRWRNATAVIGAMRVIYSTARENSKYMYQDICCIKCAGLRKGKDRHAVCKQQERKIHRACGGQKPNLSAWLARGLFGLLTSDAEDKP